MKRRTVEETTKQWMVYLNDLKYNLDNRAIQYVSDFSKKHQIDTKLGQFLKENKVIYKNNFGYYKWNEKIPVSIKIINAYRKEQTRRNLSKNRIKKHRNTNKPVQQKINFDLAMKKENNYDRRDWITINAAKEFYGKSETTMRNLVRQLKTESNPALKIGKNVNGRDIIRFNRNYLDSIYLKKQVETSVNNKDKQELGLIRRFLKWIY